MTNEQLSGWMDGEASAAEAEQIVKNLAGHGGSREACKLYWLVGDCLRGDFPRGNDLCDRVMTALETEPTVLAPIVHKAEQKRGRWMSLAAAVAGMAVAAWMGLGLWTPPFQDEAMGLARQRGIQDQPLAAAVSPAEILPDDRSYLMAHQASAVGVPMAGVAQYIRTVNVEQVGGAR
ncbi:sigma-E factor negative regulatory protein [Uliginosibacterium sp. 31-16]|uniref:sigma-E factor negative regulatory protein n=1 Tax=Uliginosibacterium sp. 31-16 TaxID=3068315 RepID=UPI00273D98EE|nr:sigma-E factor negative regulatory protein [Uliginosibacterium sp. 31-16]MDP5240858.1 sigma-E factor negative regulatory protein [Uliginosibacterium sp. 31-16]